MTEYSEVVRVVLKIPFSTTASSTKFSSLKSVSDFLKRKTLTLSLSAPGAA